MGNREYAVVMSFFSGLSSRFDRVFSAVILARGRSSFAETVWVQKISQDGHK
jgi:hypothetical protein